MKKIRLNTLWSFAFVMWFISEFTFSHSIFNVLAIGLFVGVSLLYVVKGKVCIKPVLLLFILFVAVCYINIITGHSINPANSYAYLLTLLKNFFFLFFLCQFFYVVKVDKVKKLYLFSSFWASVLLIILTILTTNSFALRGEGILANPNYLAVCDAFAIIFMCTTKRISQWKRSEVLVMTVLVLFCFLSGARKSLLAIATGIIIYFVLRYPKRLIRYVFLFIFAAAIAYIAIMKIPALYESIGHRIESLIEFLMGTGGDESVRMRYWLVDQGIQEFMKSPIIGNGLNCFLTLPGTSGLYSHNNYVELLFSVGSIGAVSYYLMHLSVLFSGFIQYLKHKRNNIVLCITCVLVLMIMDYAMVSYYERGSMLYIVFFSFMLYEEKNKRVGSHGELYAIEGFG